MNIIKGLSTVTDIDISEALSDSNTDNGRADVKLYFRFHPDVQGNNKVDFGTLGMSAEIAELCSKVVTNTDYSYLLDCTRLGYKTPETDAEEDKLIKDIKGKLLGKDVYFTVYEFPVRDLLQGTKYDGESVVNNGIRNYTKFNSSFLGVYEDTDSVFSNIQSNLIVSLDNGTYGVGRVGEKKQEKEPENRRSRRH